MNNRFYSMGIYAHERAGGTFLIAGTSESMAPYRSQPWKTIAESVTLGKNMDYLMLHLPRFKEAIIPPHPNEQRLFVGSADDVILARLRPESLDKVCHLLSGLYGKRIEPKA